MSLYTATRPIALFSELSLTHLLQPSPATRVLDPEAFRSPPLCLIRSIVWLRPDQTRKTQQIWRHFSRVVYATLVWTGWHKIITNNFQTGNVIGFNKTRLFSRQFLGYLSANQIEFMIHDIFYCPLLYCNSKYFQIDFFQLKTICNQQICGRYDFQKSLKWQTELRVFLV